MSILNVSDIASRLGGELVGDASVEIGGVAGIRLAGAGEISYVAQTRYASDAAKTKASALIVGLDWTKVLHIPVIKVPKPEEAFSEVAAWFAPPTVQYLPGIHSTAILSPDAVVGKDVHIGPYCVIGRNVSLGNRTVLVGHNIIGDNVSIGEDGLLYPLVSIREHVTIGRRAIFHNGAVIGSDGFGYHVDNKGVRTKIPQIGIVEIGDDVEIGSNSTVDRARFGRTSIGHGVKIDNLVHVGHNVSIGDHSVLIAQVGIAGSTMLGHHVIAAGQVGIAGHLSIGDYAVISAQSGVTKDIPAKSLTMGFPAIPQKEFARNQAHLHRLPELKKRVSELEAMVRDLESRTGPSR